MGARRTRPDRRSGHCREGWLARQKAQGVSEDLLSRIRTFKTTILQIPLNFPSVDMALNGEQGVRIDFNEKALRTSLVSYTPLQIGGLHWALVARMTSAEAFQPVNDLRWAFSWWGAVVLALTVIAAWLMTNQILRPVNALVDAADKVSAGDLSAR